MFITCCLSSCSLQLMVNALDASMCDYHISLLDSTGHAEFLCRIALLLQMRIEKHILCTISRSLVICVQQEGLRSLKQWMLEVASRVEYWMLACTLTWRKPKTINMAHFVVSDAKHVRSLLNIDESSCSSTSRKESCLVKDWIQCLEWAKCIQALCPIQTEWSVQPRPSHQAPWLLQWSWLQAAANLCHSQAVRQMKWEGKTFVGAVVCVKQPSRENKFTCNY